MKPHAIVIRIYVGSDERASPIDLTSKGLEVLFRKGREVVNPMVSICKIWDVRSRDAWKHESTATGMNNTKIFENLPLVFGGIFLELL